MRSFLPRWMRLRRRYTYTGRRNGTQELKTYVPPLPAWPPPDDPWQHTAETVILPRQWGPAGEHIVIPSVPANYKGWD